MKILVYLEEENLAPKGGPLAVGYYYNEEMKRRGEHTLEFNHVNKSYEEFHRKGRNMPTSWFIQGQWTNTSIINWVSLIGEQ